MEHSRAKRHTLLHGKTILLSPQVYPAPSRLGALVAVDLTAGEVLWQQPLGSIKNLAPAVVPNLNWGVPNLGGALMTGSDCGHRRGRRTCVAYFSNRNRRDDLVNQVARSGHVYTYELSNRRQVIHRRGSRGA